MAKSSISDSVEQGSLCFACVLKAPVTLRISSGSAVTIEY